MPTTLVTGAGGAIGTAICEYLLDRGHQIIGIARRPIDGFKGTFYAADLADESSATSVLSKILGAHEIDNLVNNAGRASRAALEDVKLSDFEEMALLNVQATTLCTQRVVSQMCARGKGRIVNIASKAMMGRERTSVYGATKAAVESLSRSWALELAESGITVNVVAPGIIWSEAFPRNNPPGSPDTVRLLDRIPMHRPGYPVEVAAAVSYFLLDEASYTTGQTLYVCGGWSI